MMAVTNLHLESVRNTPEYLHTTSQLLDTRQANTANSMQITLAAKIGINLVNNMPHQLVESALIHFV